MPPNNAKIYLESWMTMSLKGDYEKNLMSMFFGDIWIIWRCRNKIIFIKKKEEVNWVEAVEQMKFWLDQWTCGRYMV